MKRPVEEPRPDPDTLSGWSVEARRLLRLLEGPDDAQAGRVVPFRRPEDETLEPLA
ncbi:MAG TPA: hypothetical protein VF139_13720 [Candidatus Polarisedimenticolaceae bacterium]